MYCFPLYLCLCSLRHLFHTSLHFFQYKVNILSLLQQIASRVESTLTETHSRYVILLSLHHSPFNLCLASSCHLLFLPTPMGLYDAFPCVFVFILFYSASTLPNISSVWNYVYFTFASFPSIFVSPVAGNEYLIFSLSPLSDGLWE